MKSGSAPEGSIAVSTAPLAPVTWRQPPTLVQYQQILSQQLAPLTALAVIESIQFNVLTISPSGEATAPVASVPSAGQPSGAVEAYDYVGSPNYFSDTGYTSDPLDVPAATPFMSRIRAITLNRSVSLSPESYAEGDQSGSVTLANDDGALDNLVSQNVIDARDFQIFVGAQGDYLSRFTKIFDGVTNKWQMTNLTDVEVDFADRSYLLDRPLQQTSYAGDGGLEGGDPIVGQLKPICLGQCMNISPVLVDPVYLVYQGHCGPCESIGQSGTISQWPGGFTPSVYDSGSALTFANDVAALYDGSGNYIGGSPAPGTYITCLAEGCFVLGETPAGQVTADFQGDNDSTYAFSQWGQPAYAHTVGQIVIRGLSKFLGLTQDYFCFDQINALDYEIPATPGDDYMAGVYIVGANMPIVGEAIVPVTATNPYGIQGQVSQYPLADDSGITARQFLDDRCKGVAAYWYFDRNHALRLQRLHEPVQLDSAFALTPANIVSIGEMPLPDGLFPPTYVRRVNYNRNYTVQSGAGLAVGVTPQQRQTLALSSSCVIDQNLTTLITFPRAQNPPPLDSDLIDGGNATALAVLLMDLHGVKRQMLTITTEISALQLDIGYTISVTHPRFGLANTKYFRVFPTGENVVAVPRTVTLTLWG